MPFCDVHISFSKQKYSLRVNTRKRMLLLLSDPAISYIQRKPRTRPGYFVAMAKLFRYTSITTLQVYRENITLCFQPEHTAHMITSKNISAICNATFEMLDIGSLLNCDGFT